MYRKPFKTRLGLKKREKNYQKVVFFRAQYEKVGKLVVFLPFCISLSAIGYTVICDCNISYPYLIVIRLPLAYVCIYNVFSVIY